MQPLLSIITINKNNREGLHKTIQSVVKQSWKDFEFIVIDGASTDGSQDIIKEYQTRITFWSSKPDSGIYNAMNKGLQQATGKYCLFLNSGDALSSNGIINAIYTEPPTSDILYSDLTTTSDWNTFHTVAVPPPEKITIRYFLEKSLPHPCSLIKKSILEKHDRYSEDLAIAADFEFFFKAVILGNCSLTKFHTPISIFDITGISNQASSQQLMLAEHKLVLNRNASRILSELPCRKRIPSFYEIFIKFKTRVLH